jgi:hypothetical protein
MLKKTDTVFLLEVFLQRHVHAERVKHFEAVVRQNANAG